jgi:hypothetical protein
VRERRRRGAAGGIGLLALALCAAGCGARTAGDEGLSIRFEDHAEPAAFERTGSAVRDAPDGAPGLWAAVPGLPRPERAEIVNLDSRNRTTVALFRASGTTIRVSNEAADLLGIADGAVPVRVTALRSVPAIEQWRDDNLR